MMNIIKMLANRINAESLIGNETLSRTQEEKMDELFDALKTIHLS